MSAAPVVQGDDLDRLAAYVAGRGWRPVWIRYNRDGDLVPLVGSTGRNRQDMPRPADAVTLAIGCPADVMMYDVDQYEKGGAVKTGADTMRELAAGLGELPPTVKITSRGPDDAGGKLPYRMPAGTGLHGTAGQDIEIIQPHHRFTWAPGTTHPRTGTPVMVYGLDGHPAELPHVAELPELPAAWLTAHRNDDAGKGERMPVDVPDDGSTVCTRAQAWLDGKDFTGADPRGQRALDASVYLKRAADSGHYVAEIIGQVRDALTSTTDADWSGLWEGVPICDPRPGEDLSCCGGPDSFGMMPDAREALAAQNGHLAATASGASAAEPFTDEAKANAWAEDVKPWAFFSKDDGLLARELGNAVRTMGALAAGRDGRMWPYRHGVYLAEPPKSPVVRGRCTRLLKDSYRGSYATAAEHIVREAVPEITCEPVERYLNVPNGLLDWRTGQLYAHSPAVMSTVQLGVPWEPDAVCPWFDWWLPQVVPLDCVELVWELIGYLAYSGNPLHTAVMLVGDGRNGKGTLLRVILAILGRANVTSASLADLVGRTFTTAGLYGKIANIAGDIDGTYMESTATLKAITGMDQIEAEHKGKDRFDFTPWAVPVFSANKIPASADTTAGYLSRWLILPFPNSFAGREDRTIEAKLHAELPGILAAGVQRLPALLDRGQFGLTDSAREAKADFSRKVDQVRYWLHECCELGDFPAINRARLHQAYKRWVFKDDGKALKASEFYARLAATGVESGFGPDGSKVFRGIRVTDECIMSPADFGV